MSRNPSRFPFFNKLRRKRSAFERVALTLPCLCCGVHAQNNKGVCSLKAVLSRAHNSERRSTCFLISCKNRQYQFALLFLARRMWNSSVRSLRRPLHSFCSRKISLSSACQCVPHNKCHVSFCTNREKAAAALGKKQAQMHRRGAGGIQVVWAE